ncbi:MAG: MinD/ParA family protein [Lachnospiraceae bacterium]|nr:MinD/ParA family protein [Lachnospiraceae bacterium]
MDQAEQLRKLVSKQNRPRKCARVITVTSGKGGVGKSTVSVNLAINLSRLGKRVVILDADFGLANIEVMLGIRPANNLADLMFKGKDLADIITKGPENIGFISGGSGIQELARLTREQVVYLVQKLYQLDEMADIILVDTGAGISDSVLEFVAASSEVLLVATPEPTSITDAYALLKTLNRKSEFSSEGTSIKMIANRVDSPKEGESLFEKLSVVTGKFLDIKLEYLGGIPDDDQCSKAIMMQQPICLSFPQSQSAAKLREMAAMLVDMPAEDENRKKGISGLFNRWMKVVYKKKNNK